MTTRALNAAPPRRAVALEQLRAVGLELRTGILLSALALLLLGAALFAYRTRVGGPERLDFFPALALPLLFLAFLVPLAVWRDEGPVRRTYHLAMPVERGWHQLAKNAAGWLWLMGVVAVYLLWAWAMAALTGGEMGVLPGGVAVHFHGPRLPDEEFRALAAPYRSLSLAVPGWQWAVPFVGATTAYLLGSAVVLATNRPYLWLAGIWAVFVVTTSVVETMDLQGAEDALLDIVAGRYGLETLFTGNTLHRWTETAAGGRVVELAMSRPDPGAWLGAAALWLGAGVAGVLLVALRHRDT